MRGGLRRVVAALLGCLLLGVLLLCVSSRAERGDGAAPSMEEPGPDEPGSPPRASRDTEDGADGRRDEQPPEGWTTEEPSDATGRDAARGAGAETSLVEGPVDQAATALLASYRDAGSCALAQAGYLDLLGQVWGCVVRGDGWVDVCVVSQTGDAGRSEVHVTRLDVHEVARELREGEE